MILSHKDIEEIAAAVTMDFDRFFFGEKVGRERSVTLATPIDQLAGDYLGLQVIFSKLSADGSIMGVTAYTDTEYETTEDHCNRVLTLKRNQVVLDSRFIQQGNIRRLCPQRRFTLAHECAHQILFQLEEDEKKSLLQKAYSERKVHTPRTLKTHEDWNEWQANALGAAILMPQAKVDCAMHLLNGGKLLNSYGERLYGEDRICVEKFCSVFAVSRTAACIRLEQLGYLGKHPANEYQNFVEVEV
ncbi:MAG: ImmA/IrrE family metallo-endopeptidase [Lachnospiraceae bacterium]|nr:ImmA/IrrE family metallo-endopeptidase [Lachnospiraceae bacterium]